MKEIGRFLDSIVPIIAGLWVYLEARKPIGDINIGMIQKNSGFYKKLGLFLIIAGTTKIIFTIVSI